MGKKYFGTDGIRGRANLFPITAGVVMKVGMAAGVLFRRGDYRHRVVIGKDTRLSGYMIENALVAGFTAAGMDVLLLGPVPAPAVAMLTRSMRCDIGVMISASHNAFQDNGVKLFGPDGYKLSDRIEEQIETLIDQDMSLLLASPDELGKATRIERAVDRYVEFAKRTLPEGISLEGIRIVVDCANGAAYRAAPAVLWELGAEVITIGDRPDGFNINEGCGSVNMEKLCRKVNETRADIGIALDGDADRVLIVDERARPIDGDQIMATISEYWKDISLLKGKGVVATIMSNIGLERFLNGINLKLARTKVGDRYVVEHMRNHGFNLGGEQSGHMVMSDFTTTGDGLIAALQVLSAVQCREKPVSEVCNRFEPVPQVLKNVHCEDGTVLEKQPVIEAIEDGRSQLGKSGRVIIRRSGTEPLIRVMAEGDDKGLVNKIVDNIAGILKKVSA